MSEWTDLQAPIEGVFYDPRRDEHLIAVVLDVDEARNVAYALGLHDEGAKQLLAWADEAEATEATS